MLYMNIILIIIFIPLCICDPPYLLRSYPTESKVEESLTVISPCAELMKKITFLDGTDDESLNHTECSHDSDEAMLICKLGLGDAASLLNLDQYPLDEIKILILFVQEFPYMKVKNRVLDLCFLSRFGKSLEELAICGYKPTVTKAVQQTNLHILDIPALAIFASNIQTLLISGVNLWQSVELRQFTSLKHLVILTALTLQMHYYHSPHCADCIGAHPPASFSFHYLIPLSTQLTYFLYEYRYIYEPCKFDLLKTIRARETIPTFIVISNTFQSELDKPVCDTCESGLCPLLSVCLDENSKERRDKDKKFECLCVEDLDVEDEFISCDPMTIHRPMYSTRCNHTPSFWTYVTLPMIICVSYILLSIIVFISSTIYLLKSK